MINQATSVCYVGQTGRRNQSVMYDPIAISVAPVRRSRDGPTSRPEFACAAAFIAVTALLSALGAIQIRPRPNTAGGWRKPVRFKRRRVAVQRISMCSKSPRCCTISAKIGVPDSVLQKPGPARCPTNGKLCTAHNTVGLDIHRRHVPCEELETSFTITT